MRKPLPYDPNKPEEFRNPATETERIYSAEEAEFLKAMDAYQRANDRSFPTCSEVLAVVRALGYRKTAAPGPLPIFRRHDYSGDKDEEARDEAEG